MPNSESYQTLIEDSLREAGVEPYDCFFTSAIKCRNFELNAGKLDMKTCRQYLDAEIAALQPEWVLAFGNEALFATTGHSGIMKYRAKIIEKNGIKVIATISPAAVARNPGQRESWLADLRYFASQVNGKVATVKPPGIFYVDSKVKFDQLKTILKHTKILSYDVETVGFDEFGPNAAIVSLAGTSELYNGKVVCWALPLYHPESPFRSNWQRVLEILNKYIKDIPKQVAHNGKFDARWLRRFGVDAKVTFDTMLACHLLDENRLKGLKPQANARFGVGDWSINTQELLETPIRDVLKYNALDTYYTYHIYLETKQELIEQPRLLRIFAKLTMPANEMLIEAERLGIWIDREKLATNTKIAYDMRDTIDQKLMAWVPEGDDEELAALGWPRMGKRAKLAPVNFNPSNFARWWLFDYLELPVLAVGKDKDDGSEGAPSMAEAIMLELRGQHPAVDLLLERSKWQKYCSSFLSTYDELADENDRLHTTFKLAGTVTGRLSSGKVDQDKITSKRTTIRGVNIQQVPRDPFIRGMFGARPGYDFVEADFSQVELRVVAFLSRDKTMMRLYQTGQDIHRATAANVLGVPANSVTKDDRKKAKAVNFGFVYGMGWRKFIQTAFEKYELTFSQAEAQQIRKLFFQQFQGLFPWHARQRRLVNQYGRVQSPLGRIRHLPDIFSGDEGVRAEAERQAINSPVQSFASDMTMLSMLIINDRFKEQNLDAHVIGTVHDALLFEVRREHTARALPIIKDTMENLPLQSKFGVVLDIPIVSDLKVGTHWGDARELEAEEVYDYKG
jgi:DNA polymerase-1